MYVDMTNTVLDEFIRTKEQEVSWAMKEMMDAIAERTRRRLSSKIANESFVKAKERIANED